LEYRAATAFGFENSDLEAEKENGDCGRFERDDGDEEDEEDDDEERETTRDNIDADDEEDDEEWAE
jgi:hypothetical protein